MVLLIEILNSLPPNFLFSENTFWLAKTELIIRREGNLILQRILL